MIGSPDLELAKFPRMLNASAHLEEDGQQSMLQNSAFTEQPSKAVTLPLSGPA